MAERIEKQATTKGSHYSQAANMGQNSGSVGKDNSEGVKDKGSSSKKDKGPLLENSTITKAGPLNPFPSYWTNKCYMCQEFVHKSKEGSSSII